MWTYLLGHAICINMCTQHSWANNRLSKLGHLILEWHMASFIHNSDKWHPCKDLIWDVYPCTIDGYKQWALFTKGSISHVYEPNSRK